MKKTKDKCIKATTAYCKSMAARLNALKDITASDCRNFVSREKALRRFNQYQRDAEYYPETETV